MSEVTIFAAALERIEPRERAGYLAQVCGDDPELRRRVEELLSAHDRAGGFLGRPVAGPAGAETLAFDDSARMALDDEAAARALLGPPGRPGSLGRLGHYEVLEVLGRGGFGVVFRAFDEVLQRVVAIKLLASRLAETSPARKRFLREARASAGVRHEHVVRVYAVEERPVPYIVMEFVPGESLADRLKRTGPLEVPEVVRIGRQVASGLAAAHANGLIHRDIKPDNILVEGGPEPRARITDFGLARAVDDASLTQSGVIVGTPLYMSPEQARGGSVDQRADLFSLGSVLYAMLTGHSPFRAAGALAVLQRVAEAAPRPIREVIPEVPAWLCRVVETLLAKDPADRYPTAAAVAELLADAEAQIAVHGRVRDPWRFRARSPRRVRAAVATALLLAVGAPAAVLAVRAVGGRAHPLAAEADGSGRPTVPARVATPAAREPAPIPTAAELAGRPSPLDGLRREDIPPELLAAAGGGDPARAPDGLVAVLAGRRGHSEQVLGLAASPDGRLLASSGRDRALKIWDIASGRLVADLAVPDADGRFPAFSPDSRVVVACGAPEALNMWDVGTRRVLRALPGAGDPTEAIAYSPDGRRVAAGGADGIVRLWDAATGELVHILRGHRATVPGLAFRPDGRILASASQEGRVGLWDVDTGKGVGLLTIPSEDPGLRGVAFSPDGKDLVVTANGGLVTLWDADSGAPRKTLSEPDPDSPYPLSPAWRADGGLVAWVQPREDLVRLCDPTADPPRVQTLRTFPPTGNWVHGFALAPDGRHIFTGNPDGSIFVIRLAARGTAYRVPASP